MKVNVVLQPITHEHELWFVLQGTHPTLVLFYHLPPSSATSAHSQVPQCSNNNWHRLFEGQSLRCFCLAIAAGKIANFDPRKVALKIIFGLRDENL
jgi:hypothetical protein